MNSLVARVVFSGDYDFIVKKMTRVLAAWIVAAWFDVLLMQEYLSMILCECRASGLRAIKEDVFLIDRWLRSGWSSKTDYGQTTLVSFEMLFE